MPAKLHTCKFCREEIFRNRIAAHNTKNHIDNIKASLVGYKTISSPRFPIFVNSQYLCVCCNEMWDQKAWADKHAAQHPECSYEKQLQALWALLDMAPPQTPHIVVDTNSYSNNIKLTENDKLTTKSLQEAYSKNEQLQAKVLALEAQVAKLRETTTNSLQTKIRLIEKQAYINKTVSEEQIKMLLQWLPKESKARYESIKIDEDNYNDLINLEKQYMAYNPNYVSPNKKVKYVTVVEPQVLLPEPELESESESESEPEPHCSDCLTTEEFTKLTKCSKCKLEKCKENDALGCYMFSCNNCDKKNYCKKCYMSAGGSKLFCSKTCWKVATQ